VYPEVPSDTVLNYFINCVVMLESKPGASLVHQLCILKCRLSLVCSCVGVSLPMDEAGQAAAAQLATLVERAQSEQRSPDLRRATEERGLNTFNFYKLILTCTCSFILRGTVSPLGECRW
jgi:hypothetical protein